MFCRNGGMQPQHTNQPVFGTDGAMLYKKRAKPKKAIKFFEQCLHIIHFAKLRPY